MTRTVPTRLLVLLGLAAASAAGVASAHATATVSVLPIARDGQPSPDANGSFSSVLTYGAPFLNDSGQVVFSCRLVLTAGGSADNEVLVRGRAGETPVLIAREGQAIPDGPGAFGGLHLVPRQYAMNDSGRVVFAAPLTGTAGGSGDNQALYSAVTPGLYWRHARRGQTLPFTTSLLSGIFPPQINDQPPAAVAFFTTVGGASMPNVLYTSRLGLLSPISYVGQPAPDVSKGSGLNGSIVSYPYAGSDPPALRPNANEVGIYAHAAPTANAPIDDDGIYRASPDGFVDMARGGQPAPGGGTYQEFWSSPVYDANGISAFGAYLSPVPSAGQVIALDWPYGGDLVAYTGQSAADGNGILSSFYEPSLNNHEAVSYRVLLSGTAGGGLDDEAIYKGDSSLLVVPALEDQIAREGQAPPGGNGVYAGFGSITAINDAGQVLFYATLRSTVGGASDDHGLYLWDPTDGVVALVRESDVIDGRHVASISALSQRDYGGTRSLNQRGEAVALLSFVEFGADGVYLLRVQHSAGVAGHGPRSGAALALRVGPNPARSAVAVHWAVAPGDTRARLWVLDALGRQVRVLSDGAVSTTGELRWDLTDDDGRPVAAGIYFVMLETPSGARARRLACMR